MADVDILKLSVGDGIAVKCPPSIMETDLDSAEMDVGLDGRSIVPPSPCSPLASFDVAVEAEVVLVEVDVEVEVVPSITSSSSSLPIAFDTFVGEDVRVDDMSAPSSSSALLVEVILVEVGPVLAVVEVLVEVFSSAPGLVSSSSTVVEDV